MFLVSRGGNLVAHENLPASTNYIQLPLLTEPISQQRIQTHSDNKASQASEIGSTILLIDYAAGRPHSASRGV